ncbi:cation transporter [Chromatiales bacterium (ex Bugula neritina AB1)]|nr:cation transporter [Chromatiales bacterium (ex Bugula neritina AB1)]
MPGCNDCPSDQIADNGSDPLFRRVLWFALIANFMMFIVEMVASRLGDSMSLQADALDFLGDSANYAISLFVVGSALLVRARAALFKGATMALFGIWVIGSAVHRAIVGSAPEPLMMSSIAVLALLVNVVVAVMLYRFRDGDSNRQSIWLCSRNDAIGNVAVMLAAAGVFASSSRWPDLFVAALIAGLNISAALQVVVRARSEIHSSQSNCEPDSTFPQKIGVG